MRRLVAAAVVMLAACGSKGREVTVTVAGVTAAELDAVKTELANLPGVSEVRAGSFKEGQAVFTLVSTSTGGDLAGALAKSGSGLKNVKGFDDGSVQISFDGKAAPVAAAPAPEKGGPEKEVKVPVEKDPLAYKVHPFNGGTIATFDGWKFAPPRQDGNWIVLVTSPEGKEDEFQVVIFVGTPTEEELGRMFELAPQRLQQLFPAWRAKGAAKKTTFGGDAAMIESYDAGEWKGQAMTATAIYVKRKDIAVAVVGIGSAAGNRTYGRAVEITAQSITFQEAALEPELCGTWNFSSYKSSGTGSTFFSYSSSTNMTIYPNGTFTKRSMSTASGSGAEAYTDGGERGTVTKRGTNLTFRNDKGEVWNMEYKLEGGALLLNNALWTRN
jgi:hypothetical protein